MTEELRSYDFRFLANASEYFLAEGFEHTLSLQKEGGIHGLEMLLSVMTTSIISFGIFITIFQVQTSASSRVL